ncbi:hypothetical protein B0A55_04309 [Friedmanniomyces simplex]|uniref:V-SNARE coiled-coil homology domain-containing protein n=1 Tax=Friedmanniomyces simplex TaxID=329884 RepID=A0A4U0X7P5_9PEZI|nr:hypothetical protein B0A55_04309 [Friedmanniomyces simplex]
MSDRLYDPHLSQGAGGSQGAGISRTQAVHDEIDSAMKQIEKNIQLTSQRGERLDEIQDKTDALAGQASQFRRGANRVRKQMWWKDMKMRMCIIIGIIVLLIVIIVPSVIYAGLGDVETVGVGAGERRSAAVWTRRREEQEDGGGQ